MVYFPGQIVGVEMQFGSVYDPQGAVISMLESIWPPLAKVPDRYNTTSLECDTACSAMAKRLLCVLLLAPLGIDRLSLVLVNAMAPASAATSSSQTALVDVAQHKPASSDVHQEDVLANLANLKPPCTRLQPQQASMQHSGTE